MSSWDRAYPFCADCTIIRTILFYCTNQVLSWLRTKYMTGLSAAFVRGLCSKTLLLISDWKCKTPVTPVQNLLCLHQCSKVFKTSSYCNIMLVLTGGPLEFHMLYERPWELLFKATCRSASLCSFSFSSKIVQRAHCVTRATEPTRLT